MYQLLQILTYSQAQQNGLVCPQHIDTLWQVYYTEKFPDEKVEKNMAQKIIYGTVSDDGTKQVGEGFEVQSSEPGLYVITFLQPFVTTPVVVTTLNGWGADNQIVVKDTDLNKFQVSIWDLEVKQQSGSTSAQLEVKKEKSSFNFIAIGEGN